MIPIRSVKESYRVFRQKLLAGFMARKCMKICSFGGDALVIAPHPDDETFGCGGLMAAKVRAGKKVSVVFLTNGEKSLTGHPAEEVAGRRKESALRALEKLGLDGAAAHWLELPDGSVPRRGSDGFAGMKERLLEILNRTGAEELYTTGPLEGWSDHLAAWELATDAAKEVPHSVDLYLYWVWAWYYTGLTKLPKLPWHRMGLLSLEETLFEKKREALACYTQNRTEDGLPYMGELPAAFLRAFEWPYEVFAKVETDEV
jgi:LmbE family N-acetylglucosaminyl deacetylase